MSRLSFLPSLKRCVMGAIAAVLLLAGAYTQPARALQASCPYTYVVQPGDNLFRIGLSVGVSWVTLQQMNGIPNPNLIYVGQVLCLPAPPMPTAIPGPTATPGPTVTPGGPTAVPTPTTVPGTGIVLPPAGIYPSISFSTRSAAPGDTITIFGINFPTNESSDILITPLNSLTPYTAVATTVTSPTGTVDTPFTIPTTINGVPLQGYGFSIMVRGRQTGYFGFNYIYNSHGY